MRILLQRLLDNILDFISAIFNVGIRLKYVLALLILFTGGAVALTYNQMLNNVGGRTDYEEAMRYIALKDLIEEHFIDPVDRSTMTDSASASIVAGLGDKWSYYMTPDEYKSYQLYSSNDYSDIGISMIKYADGGFQIVSVTPGTPSANAGLTPGMIITAIDDVSVLNSDIDDVRILIRSRLNTQFNISVGKDVYTVDCSRVYSSPVVSRLEKTMAGYVQIRNFEAGTAQDAIDGIERLLNQGAVALCIDLRNNPGGLDTEVAAFLDYLLPSGRLFIKQNKIGRQEITESDGMCIQLPMCVLIDGNTFSEAEGCAAALQEFQWATLIGEPTTGKTRTQETIVLSDGSAVRLSTGTYLTGLGVDISARGGVSPAYIMHNSDPSATGTTAGTTGDSSGSGVTSNDEQLMYALKLLS